MTTLHTITPRKRSSARSRKNRVILAACGSGLLPAAAAFGAPVAPGARDVPLLGTSVAATGEVVGDVRTSFSIDDTTSGEILLAGTVEHRVIREPGGTLTFLYTLTNTADAPDLGHDLLRFTAFGYSPALATDVDFLIGGGHPTTVTRNNEVIDVRFDDEDGRLEPGESVSFFVRTDAIDFETGGFAIADARAASQDPDSGEIRSALIDGTFKPVAVVPLPAAIYSGAVGLLSIVALKRKRWI